MVNIKPKKSNTNPIEESSFFIIQNEFKTDLNENDPLYELANKVRLHYVTERPYLKPKYSIGDLALELETQENHLVYCFNSVFKVSFTKLKNHLRIEYAKELLKGEIHDNFTIDAISHKSGFSTRSNFYNTFNKVVGCSPTDYLKSIKS
jgi:AraC-like DNA-binding protein